MYTAQLPELTKTFREAIEVARRLEVEYIWIDSLCIIQDDQTDWITESARMSNVYQRATCNIAATASRDGDGGLFFDRDLPPPYRIRLDGSDGNERIFLLSEDEHPKRFSREVENAPLLKVCQL